MKDIDPYVVEKARALCLGYFYHYGSKYRTLGIEIPFRLPLLSPVDGNPIQGAKPYTGKIDWIVRAGDRLLFADRKTTSKADHAYWEKLKTDAQLSHYYLAAKQCDINIDGILWDVIVKPKNEVKQSLTKADIEEIETGSYCGLPIVKSVEVEWKSKEPAYLYGLRLLAKVIESPEDTYIQRVLYRSADDLYDYWEDMVSIEAEMRACTSITHARKNRGNCGAYGQVCPFISLCANEDPNQLGFRKKEFKESSDSKLFAGGISTSAMAEFQSCKRRWWYNRKENLEPVYAKPDDNTDLGTLVHSGLEIVARATMTEERVVLHT